MRHTLRVLPAVLCVLVCGAAYGQSASSNAKLTPTKNPMSFTFDAQHDQVVANGFQVKPAAIGAISFAPTTGTVAVTVNITDVSHFRRGTTYHCALTAIGGELDITNGVVSGGIETASGMAHWTGTNTLSCTLTIPYEWTLVADPGATRGAILAFGVAAVAPASDGSVVQRSTLQVDGVEPLPASGATSTFTFSVTL